MSDIVRYNKETEQWEIVSSTDALNINILDTENNFESDNVEGALRELGNLKNNVNINKTSIDAIKSTLRDHMTNHPTGGGGGTMPTIESEWNETTIDGDSDFTIPIYYTSPNLGDATCYILINGIETAIQVVSQGNNSVRIPALGSGTKKLSIYVKDRGGLMSNQLTWNIVCGGIKLTVTMDKNIDYTLNDRILLTYNIECDLTEEIVAHIKIDDLSYSVPSNSGYNSYEIKGLSVGVHKIEIYASCGIYETPTQVFNIIIVATDTLFVTSSFDTNKQYEKGNPINVEYRISISDTRYYTVNLYIDNFEYPVKTLSQQAGVYYWTINEQLSLGEHTIRIEVYDESRTKEDSIDLTFTLVASSYAPMTYVESGLLAWFDAKGRTNSDVDRSYWVDKVNGYIGRLYNFNYGTNGWLDDKLVFNGSTYVEIDMKPFENNVTRGLTIDMVFSTKDIGNPNAKVIDCTGLSAPYTGLYINPYKAKLISVEHNAELDIGQEEEIQITYMIDRVSKFAKIFVNSVLCACFQLSDSSSGSQIIYEAFNHAQKIYLNSEKGTSNFGDCYIKRLMIYERELTDEEVLRNRMADMPLEEQEEEYNRNYNESRMPCMYVYGTDIDKMTLTNKIETRIKYVSPNADLYGSSFEYPNCKMYWQGTSSIAYANKNYNFELYDSDRNPVFYTPYKNGIPENLFCIKCNQMESSNAMNTGLATFVNDNLYTVPNPAQVKNSKVRQAIEGFPILLYINDEFRGVYDFNLDRYSFRSYGYNLFDDCLAYEISANSDTTAGAFNKYSSSSGKSEGEYYAADFECLYPPSRQNGNDNFAELKALIQFVDDAEGELFTSQFDTYFDRQSVFRYYLFTQVFGCVDSLGKNMKLVTFDKVKWYIQAYDIDTAIGLDNTGALRYDVDIEVEQGVFNTSNSKLWSKIRLYFANELKEEYQNLRKANFTLENMLTYLYDRQIEKIPPRYYNKSTQFKYLNYGSKYLYACHGNRYFQIKKWLKERLLYCDTLFGYDAETSNFITVRCNKQGMIYLNIQTYSPMYLSVKWRDEANGTGIQTLKIPRNGTGRFSYHLPSATDQEVIIYAAEHIKSLGDLSACNPVHLLLSNATRLNDVVCRNNPKLVIVQIEGCNYLQRVDLNGCTNLGTLVNYQNLNLSTCDNLKYLDIRGTKLLSVNFNNNGGNLVEIYLPKTIQSLYLRNQYSLRIVGLPYYRYSSVYHTEALNGASNITSFSLINCPLVERLTESTSYSNNRDFYDFYGNWRSSDSLGDYEDYNEFLSMMRFGMGLCNATSIHIENSMLSTKKMSFRFNYRLEHLILRYLPNLEELTIGETQSGHNWTSTNDMCGSFDYNNLEVVECPNINTFRIHQYINRNDVWFNSGTDTIDLTKFTNLKKFSCNITTQDLSTIILPSSLEEFWIKHICGFTTSNYDNRCLRNKCNLKNIYFKEDHPDGYEGIDFGNRLLKEVCLTCIPKATSVIGINTKNIKNSPVFNYLPNKNGEEGYPLVKPQGRIDLSEYDWRTMQYWFTNIDFTTDDIEFIMPNNWDYLIDSRVDYVRGIFNRCKNPNFTWDFASRFFKHLQDRECLSETYYYARLQEQTSYEESAVTLYNSYNISDYNYGATPFEGSNLKYVNDCTFAGNAIAYGTFRNSNLVKIGTVTCSGTYTWWSSENLFRDSKNLIEVECVNMPRSASSIGWFQGCSSLQRVGTLNINSENTSSLYYGCRNITEFALPVMTNCKNIANMFRDCKKITNIALNDITETTPLENMYYAFSGCSLLETVSIGGETLPNTLTNMEGTYKNSPKLTNVIPLPSDFTNKCTMNSCCQGCNSLTDDAIYSVIPYNVSNMNNMYRECHSLVNPVVVVNSDRADAQCMFYGNSQNLKTLDVRFNGTYLYGMNEFAYGCSYLTDVYLKFPYSLYFNESEQTNNTCESMFAYCTRLVNVDLDMSYLETKARFSRMFRQDKYIERITGFDLSNLHRNDQYPNDIGHYLTYETSFEFMRDWIFAKDENNEEKKLTSSYRFQNLELVPLATLDSLIKGLGQVTAETLTLGQATVQRLTEEQIASAVAKGWTIV